MDGPAADASEYRCPLCAGVLTSDAYARVRGEMQKRADEQGRVQKESFESEIARMRKEHESQISRMAQEREEAEAARQKSLDEQSRAQKESYESEIARMREEQESKLSKLMQEREEAEEARREGHAAEMRQVREEADAEHKRQLEAMEESYKGMMAENAKQLEQLKRQQSDTRERETEERDRLEEKHRELEAHLKESHRKEMEERDREVLRLEEEREELKRSAREEVDAAFEKRELELKKEMLEKDVQLERAKREVENLGKKLEKKQPELMGEVGERELHRILSEAFSNDMFRPQRRGQSSADLVQEIRVGGRSIDTPIAYDSKNASRVTVADIAKAKRYQKTHGTNYVIIVSANLPKTYVPNGLYGSRDGIIMAHPSIIVEVARQIRSGIIEVSKLSTSRDDQKSKQARMYRFITGTDFARIVGEANNINRNLNSLQEKEEKDHQTLWKKRRALYEQQVKVQGEMESSIESITQSDEDELPEEEALTMSRAWDPQRET